MFEKLKEKLKKIFAEKGIDEGTTEEVLVELDREEEEPKPEEQEPAPIPEEPTVEAEGEEEPKEEPEAILPDEAQAEAVPLPEEAPAEEPQEIVEEPQFDYEGMKAELDEYKKTVDALLARTESLEEALRAGGVIEGAKPEKGYGVDKPSAPAKDPVGDGLDEFFRNANRKSF